jgi:hypothetical protein
MSYGNPASNFRQGHRRREGGCHSRREEPPRGVIDLSAHTIVGGLNRIADNLEGLLGNDQQAAAAGPHERTFSRYSVGTGEFYVDDGQGVIVVQGRMYTFGGEEDGEYQAVFRAWFSSPEQLFQYPPASQPPYDAPSPVPSITDVNQTKARWTFADGSSLSGPGPAISYIAALKDGYQFWVSAATFLTGGTGRYAGAIGQETSLGSTYFSGTTPPVLEPGTTFPAKVTHTFRVVLAEDRGEIPQPPSGGGGGGKSSGRGKGGQGGEKEA